MNNFFRLNVYLTIQSPDGKDVRMFLSRTLPFQPVEGLTMLIPAEQDEELDEFPLELGAPTYSYNQSAFVDYQSDDSVLDAVREGANAVDAMRGVVEYYRVYGFMRIVE